MIMQIPKLEAEERLHLISDMAVATGCVKKGVAQSHRRQLERFIEGSSRPATKTDLEQLGFVIDGL